MVAFRRQPHQPAADQTGVAAVEVWARVAGFFRGAPLRRRAGVAEDVVVGVEGVDVGAPRFEFRVERKAEQPPVAGVVDVGPQVGEQFRRRVFEVFVDVDLARLGCDEDAAVGGEAEVGRLLDVGDRDFVLEAGRQRRFRRGQRRQRQQRPEDQEQ